MSGEGVLQWIDDTELGAWAQAAATRAAVAGLAAGDATLEQFREGGSAATPPASFQVQWAAERGLLLGPRGAGHGFRMAAGTS